MNKNESLAGSTVLVKIEKEIVSYLGYEYWMDALKIENGKAPVAVKEDYNGDVTIECIVAGDDPKKGLSLVEINTGAQLICAIPKYGIEHVKSYETCKKLIPKGNFTFGEYLNSVYGDISNMSNGGSMSSCPYK